MNRFDRQVVSFTAGRSFQCAIAQRWFAALRAFGYGVAPSSKRLFLEGHGEQSVAEGKGMRKVFSSIDISETVLVRDALLHSGVEATIQNEHSGRSAVPGFRPPAEVWVTHDDNYDAARRIVLETIATLDSKSDAKPWRCSRCREENPQSFEICWNCGRDKGSVGDAD